MSKIQLLKTSKPSIISLKKTEEKRASKTRGNLELSRCTLCRVPFSISSRISALNARMKR